MTDLKEPQDRVIKFQDRLIPVDEDGHLLNVEDWSEDLAVYLAKIDGVTLTDQHWEVIRFIKDYYVRFATGPMPKIIIKNLNRKHGSEIYTIKKLYALFTDTPMRRACQYAGIPQTAGCT
ncbi:MAG: TusE/DsrC/DsvC family sulfur relay protein [Thermodesulfovibrionales bacterium]